MAYLIDSNLTSTRLKKFNGLRRTQDGMLYLTSVDPNTDTTEITISKYYEEGKSDLVPRDGQTDYVEERLELENVQTFTGDGSTTSFTVSPTGLSTSTIAVYIDGVRKTAFSDYSLSGTTLSITISPSNGTVITVGQIKKRRFNNDSDKYQQFVYDNNSTATYLINSNGELIRRINDSVSRSALTSDDFDTFDTDATVNSTTYQDAV